MESQEIHSKLDANPRRFERQRCSGWLHTMGQPLYKVPRKYINSRFHWIVLM